MIVPIAYFVAAYAALLLAMITVAREPASIFVFLQPSVAGTVHLVTLGWITGTILGAVYVVGPLALRLRLEARRLDYVALAVYLIGASGLVAHFWIQEYSGMAWSAAMVWVAVVLVLGRVWEAMDHTPLEPGVKLHLSLSFLNFVIAGGMGFLLGLNRVTPILQGATTGVLFAHAHAAAIGWATMLAIGVGARVLPMILPARPTGGYPLAARAWLIEGGLIVLVPALIVHSQWTWLGAVLISAGLIWFVIDVSRMAMRRLPPNRQIRVPLVAPLHVGVILVCLLAAVGVGLRLAFSPPGTHVMPLALTYGVLGLLGFLGQLIAAVQARMMPLFAWYWIVQRAGAAPPQGTPYTLPAWRAEPASAALWTLGVLAMATGAFHQSPTVFSIGAALIGGAAAIGLTSLFVTVGVAFARRRADVRQAPVSRVPNAVERSL
jgi:hypothetical protein